MKETYKNYKVFDWNLIPSHLTIGRYNLRIGHTMLFYCDRASNYPSVRDMTEWLITQGVDPEEHIFIFRE